MFQIMNMWDNIAFGIVSGIYSTVARVYDILLQLVENNGSLGDFAFADIAATMYVLAGVFMLFRVTIGMIQMVINPDQMNDKQAGAGKLITRIVTSIILLLAFVPNGLLFGSDGLFKRLERALLANDGLIEQFMNMDGEYSKINIEDIDGLNKDFVIENVSAAEPALTCYYVNKKSQTWTNPGNQSASTYLRYEWKIGDVYKIEFYNGSGGTTGNLNCNNGKCKYSYTVRSDQLIGGKSENGYYASFPGKITMGNVFDGGFPSSCPKSFEKVNGHYAPKKKFAHGNSFDGCGTNTVQTNGQVKCNNVGIMGGYTSLSFMTKQIKKLKPSTTGESHTVESSNPYISKNTGQDALNKTNTEYLNNLENPDEAIGFAQTSAKSFQECKVDKVEECDAAQGEMFKTVQGNNDVKDLLDKEDMRLDFITSVIAGIGLIIYLLILCVDVIVRKFKLLLLEMIAPIPIISYVDPKDKVFNQWLKMYFSVYVDLFIKLIAIGLAINLLEMLEDTFPSNEGLLVKFFYIVAILVFAKLVPSMISKIFGLDSMGGSFKDIMGMAKGAAGFGAGAVLGGAAGLMTGANMFAATKGQGVGNRMLAAAQGIGGGFSGMARGAGAGSKGKIFEGAKNISSANASRRQQYASGIRPTDLIAAGTLGKVGMDYASRTDKAIALKNDQKDTLNKYTGFKGDIEGAAEDGKFMKTLRQQVASGTAKRNFTEKEMQSYRDAWAEYQIASSNVANSVNKSDFKSNLDEQLASGQLTQSQYDAQLAARTKYEMNQEYGALMSEISSIESDTGLTFEVEGGKQAAIVSAMNKANALLSQSSDVSSAAGVTEVTTFKELADANTKVKKTVTRLDEEIYSATTADPKYNISKASGGGVKDKK